MALVEWGNLAAPVLGRDALDITLAPDDGEDGAEHRRLTVVGRGSWAGRAADVAAAWPEAIRTDDGATVVA